MSLGHIVHFVGARSPSITGQITLDGGNPNLPGGTTAKFRMRNVKNGTLKVDSAAVLDNLTTGTWHYDPAALDVDTAGFYVGWLQLLLPGAITQDTPEFLIEIKSHDEVTDNSYVSNAELKETLGMKETFADADVDLAVGAASRAVDNFCRRVFYPEIPVPLTRSYTPISGRYLLIDDAISITSVVSSGTTLLLNTDYYTGGRPSISTLYGGAAFSFPRGVRNSVVVTGAFGFAAVPPEVKAATSIIAAQILRRSREATFGVLGVGFDGTAVRISMSDPDVDRLVGPWRRSTMIE